MLTLWYIEISIPHKLATESYIHSDKLQKSLIVLPYHVHIVLVFQTSFSQDLEYLHICLVVR